HHMDTGMCPLVFGTGLAIRRDGIERSNNLA
ncbi:unnamed protein product, partial [marine sediment metagenome]